MSEHPAPRASSADRAGLVSLRARLERRAALAARQAGETRVVATAVGLADRLRELDPGLGPAEVVAGQLDALLAMPSARDAPERLVGHSSHGSQRVF